MSTDVKIMNPIVESTLNVLEVMVQLKAEKVGLNLEQGNKFFGDISAYYPIKSDLFFGFFCISFPKDSYLKTMEAMLFEEFTEINDENRDGIGELCNQIFGNAKARYNEELNCEIQMASPVIEEKETSQIIAALPGSKVVIEFKSDAGNFFVEICMMDKK